MYARIFREDISQADLRKAGLKNPQLGAPKHVPGTKPLNIFDPADYLKARDGSDKVRADAGLLYHQAQHGMGWIPGADMTGMFGASLADFHPSKYITSITPEVWPGAVLKGDTMNTKMKTAIKSATGGFLMLDSGMTDVGHHKISKFGRTDRENGTPSNEPKTSTSVAAHSLSATTTAFLHNPAAMPNTSDAVRLTVLGETEMDEILPEDVNKKEGFSHLFKMNPNHDKAGLFASGSGGEGKKLSYHPRMIKPGEHAIEVVQHNEDGQSDTSLGHLPTKFDSMDKAKAHADFLNKPAGEQPQKVGYPTEPVTVDSTGKWNGSDLKPGEKPAEGHAIPAKPTGPRPIHEIAREIKRTWSKQGKGVNYAAKPYLDAMGSLESGKDSYGQDSAHSVLAYFLGNANSFKGPDAKRLKDELKQHMPKSKKEEGFTHLFKAIGPIKHGAFHAYLGKSPDQPITDADIERGLKAGGHPAKMAEFAKASRGWSHGGKKD